MIEKMIWKKMKKEDCILLNLYGDGNVFTEPVWYSCGACEKCARIPKDLKNENDEDLAKEE